MYRTGKRIGVFRELKGFSVEAFAQAAEVEVELVLRWEAGQCSPDADLLAKICAVLEMSADELLGIDASNSKLTAEEERLVDKYRSKTDMQRPVRVLLGLEES